MTMRTRTRVACPCGHEGVIIESENDQPYSTEWRMVDVEDLGRRGSYGGPNPLFAEVKPSCPSCGRSLGPEHEVPRS